MISGFDYLSHDASCHLVSCIEAEKTSGYELSKLKKNKNLISSSGVWYRHSTGWCTGRYTSLPSDKEKLTLTL